MKKFGILSDTHVQTLIPEYLSLVEELFQGVDEILHCGDIVSHMVLEELRTIAPVRAVAGNMDPYTLKAELPSVSTFSVEGVEFGMTHGSGGPVGIQERIRKLFRKEIQVILFGHTHYPFNQYIGKTLFFNPGSIVDKRFAPFNSAGIITVNNEIVQGEIIRL